MEKTYNDFMSDISQDELYRGLLAFGMFADKLPPVFTSESFFDYCQQIQHNFENTPHQLISYENMRNINIPRHLSIPNPFAYQRLCRCIADNWNAILTHFNDKTQINRYKVSRIHIRKITNSEILYTSDYDHSQEFIESFNNGLFDMNYTNWKTDGNPETDILLGKRWLVRADISNCFPSIYTHSIPWALVGKDTAKNNRRGNVWYNRIDKCSQNIKYGETNGVPIGPHTSNLLSEIILVAIDNGLHNSENSWDYIRKIDDYTCYTNSREDAELFLTELNKQLREYNLSLNHKKTEILELPIASGSHWTRQMEHISHYERKGRLDYKAVRSYLDSAIELMDRNNANSSILKYAIKVLSRQTGVTDNAKAYISKTAMNLCVIYPYLISLLDVFVFTPFNVDIESIALFSNIMLESSLRIRNYEAASYCVYFAIKYGFTLDDLLASTVIESANCVFITMTCFYYSKVKSIKDKEEIVQHAKKLASDKDDFEQNWLFIYECLSASELPDSPNGWKELKNNGISFLRDDFVGCCGN